MKENTRRQLLATVSAWALLFPSFAERENVGGDRVDDAAALVDGFVDQPKNAIIIRWYTRKHASIYPRDVFRRLGDLTRSGLHDIDAIRTRSFPLDALPAAMEAAAPADGLECTVVKPS
jgi:hypothetical protein